MCSKNIEKQKHNIILKSNQNCSMKILLNMLYFISYNNLNIQNSLENDPLGVCMDTSHHPLMDIFYYFY